jgi:hypothetical protein
MTSRFKKKTGIDIKRVLLSVMSEIKPKIYKDALNLYIRGLEKLAYKQAGDIYELGIENVMLMKEMVESGKIVVTSPVDAEKVKGAIEP